MVDLADEAVAAPARLQALAFSNILDTPPEQDFDDLAYLAAELCDAPVALVSFVDAERQWFKARVGFPLCETDLGRSVCRFVLSEPDLLVIADLSQDPRTAANSLVTGEPHIRFYAGAPLREAGGQVLGSLCVIDTAPRPQGLSSRQADNLRRLARQVVSALEMRRVMTQRDVAYADRAISAAEVASSEAHWRGLFKGLREGFVLGEAVRDAGGAIVDWRCLEVNAAWGEQVGIDEQTVVGKTISEVFPGIEREWIDLADVVDGGEPVLFTRQVGPLGRWYDGRASAVDHDTFSVLFLEVTDRVRASRAIAEASARRTALAELSDCLRASFDAKAMGQVAASIVGRTLGAHRAGYGSVDVRSETVDIPSDWSLPGVATIAGRHAFREFGTFIGDLRQGFSVAVIDVKTDPRTAAQSSAWEALGVRSLINAPVLEQGNLAAVCFAQWTEPREIALEEQAFIRSAAERTQVGIARLRAEERQAVLNGEISHRLKNTLSMVQAIAAQTLRATTPAETLSTFDARLMALSKAQDVLLRSEWEAADLHDLTVEVLDAAGAKGRYSADGPAVRVGPRAALSASLLLHELTTNALKYGALTSSEGQISVSWSWSDGEDPVLQLAWEESGGPPATPPTRKGFGTRLLSLGLVGSGGTELSYRDSGFAASFRAPKTQVEGS